MSAANFAPYQPSPDERQRSLATSASSSRPSAPDVHHSTTNRNEQIANGVAGQFSSTHTAAARASLDTDFDPRYATESYQSSSPYSPNYGQNQPAWAKSAATGGPPTSIESQFKSPQQPTWSTGQSMTANSISSDRGRLGPEHSIRPDHLSYSTSQGWNLSNLCFATWSFPPFTSVLLLIWETENDLVRFHAYQAGMFGIGIVLFLWILRSLFGWYTLSIIVGMAALGYSWVCGSNAANAAPTLTRSPFLPILGPLAEQWVGEE